MSAVVRKIEEQDSPLLGFPTPFSQAHLNEIFTISAKRPDCVNSRENSSLEFKESFNTGALATYTRTCAAFANTKGGHVVFGIANKPHRLAGLNAKALALFEGLDPEKVSGFLNEHFAPEIHWDIHVHQVAGKDFGLLYIHESREKPVVCTKDAGADLKEGDIYYRYRGRTTRIKYPELRAILEDRRREEEELWLRHLTKLARVGVRDAGIFDLTTGQVSGTSGAFVIDESLLSQLSFIKEGEFSEVSGKPTLKVIGRVQAATTGSPVLAKTRVIRSKGIRIGDIILAFLNQEKVEDPEEYVKQICFEATAFLPVYYFMRLLGYDKDKMCKIVEGVVSRSPAKEKLIARLNGGSTQQLSLPGCDTLSAKRKRHFFQQARKQELDENLSGQELLYCLQGIRALQPNEVKRHAKYLCGMLRMWFNKYYSAGNGALVDNLRRTICWLDEALCGQVNNA